MGLSELLTSKNLLIAGLVVGLICLVILLSLAGTGKGLNFLPAVTLVGVAALNLASVAYLAPPAPKTTPATVTGQYEPEEEPEEKTVMGQYEPVKNGGDGILATLAGFKNSVVDKFFDDALHEYGIYFDDLMHGKTVSLDTVDKFLKANHVKVRKEEPTGRQESSVKFIETTLRNAWQSWATLTHPDEEGKALATITSYAKDIARQFEEMNYKIKGATPIVRQLEIILVRIVPEATNQ